MKHFITRGKLLCLFWFTGWSNISLGITINVWLPNLEIHLPFFFFRIGREGISHMEFAEGLEVTDGGQ